MTTEIITETFLDTELKKYNTTDVSIAELSEECMALKVASVVDKEGYLVVKTAHSKVRKKRIEIEEKRKDLKAESRAFGLAVDTEAKRITALLAPIEEHLLEQKMIVDDEELRIANEKARQAQEVIDEAEAIKKKEEEDKQVKIKADQEAENARLEGIRKEQEAKEKELQDKQDKIDAENKQIADDKLKLEHEKQRKVDIAKAEEEAHKDVEEKAEHEKQVQLELEEQHRKDEALRVALMPDNEKLIALANTIESIEMPALSHDDSHIVLGDAKIYLEKACKTLRQ